MNRPSSLFLVTLAFSLTAQASELPQAIIPAGVGVNIHFTRGHERDLDLIAAAGIKFIRMDFGWAGIERQKGQYDWSAYDELTGNLEKRGLHAVYIFDYSNPLYEETVRSKNPVSGQEHQDTASPQHPESVAAFAHWAAASARHFHGRPIVWEIWNEPNITFWKPKPDVRQYTELARATCVAVREIEPDATIVGPATSGIPLDYLESFLKSGVADYLDAISVHPYRNYNKSPETAIEDYQKLRTLIDQRPLVAAPGGSRKTLPILSGEWGYASHTKGVSVETQAAYAARQQLVNLLGGVPLSIWYDWKNDGPDAAEREHNFGTVTADLKLKPAYIALQTLTRELAGYRVERRLKTESDKDYVLLCIDSAGHQKLAAWTLNPSNTVALYVTDTAKPIQVVTSDGRASTARKGDRGLALDLGPAPAYVSLAPARIQE
jgi:polysaccharide biosynthesis protein PslG